jgi:hypothetical protein
MGHLQGGVEAVVEDLADDEQAGASGGGLEGAAGRVDQGGERAGLAWTLGLLHQRHREPGIGSVLQQSLGQGLDGPGSHIDGEGAAAGGEFAPVRLGFGQVVAFQDGDPAAHLSMGEGEADPGGGPLEGADTGNHLEGNARGLQSLGLFATPAEDQGVTTLEADHPAAGPGVVDQALVNVGLKDTGPATPLPHGQGQGPLGKEVQEGRIQQGVVVDDLSRLQGPKPPHRNQIRVPRASPDQADEPPFGRGPTLDRQRCSGKRLALDCFSAL